MTRANLMTLAFAPQTSLTATTIALPAVDLVGTPIAAWGITSTQSYRIGSAGQATIQWVESTNNFMQGKTYVFSLYARSDRPGTARLSLGFGSGPTTTGESVALGGDWTRVSVSAAFPSSATAIQYSLIIEGTGAGARIDVVGKMAELGVTPGPFFNGDGSADESLTVYWRGAERASVSLAEPSFIPRRNLVDNPSFSGGLTTGWTATGGATLQTQSTGGVSGGHFVYLNHGQRTEGVGITYQRILVEPHLPYAASAYVIVPRIPVSTKGANVTISITWRNQGGTILRVDSATPSYIDRGDDWRRVSIVGYAPEQAVQAVISITRPDSPPLADDYIGFDGIMFEQRRHVLGFVNNLSEAVRLHTVSRAFAPLHKRGMELRGDITLDNLVLNTIDEQGTTWVCTDIDGWWTLPDPSFPTFQRQAGDGEHPVTGRYEARRMTLTGVFIPKRPEDVDAARDRLVRAADLVRRGAWLRTSEDPTKAAWVRLGGRPQIQTVNTRGRTDFTIPLVASDPLRYGWNDADPEGLTRVSAPGDAFTVQNDGTATVSGTYLLKGPLGAGSTASNDANGESLVLSRPLRGDAPVATVIRRSLTDGIATLETSADPHLRPGDKIIVSGVGAPFDTVREPYTVLNVNSVDPSIVTYRPEVGDTPYATGAARGFISLAAPDLLEVDTLNRSVRLNGVSYGYRNMLRTNTDWPSIEPGPNPMHLDDTASNLPIRARYVDYDTKRVELFSTGPHFLREGEEITVAIPTTAVIVQREIANRVAYLTTEEPHGIVVGDIINVVAETVGQVRAKSVTANVVTITTDPGTTYATGDSVQVSLPTTAQIVRKGVVNNVVTITTSTAHGYSNGDSVTVTLPTTAVASKKSATLTTSTITTRTAHGFSVGDSVTIPVVTSFEMASKSYRDGIVTLTSDVTHGVSVGDTITVTLPGNAVTTGARSSSGSSAQTFTIATSAASRYSVGDMIRLNLGYTTRLNVSGKTATATTTTLTTATAASGWLIGDVVQTTTSTGQIVEQGPITAISGTSITFRPVIKSSTAITGVTNATLAEGFTGEKVLTAVSDTGLTFFGGWMAQYALSGTPSAAPNGTIVNVTNDRMRGTHQVLSTPTPTTLTYRSN